jgi:hypothetical protein
MMVKMHFKLLLKLGELAEKTVERALGQLYNISDN